MPNPVYRTTNGHFNFDPTARTVSRGDKQANSIIAMHDDMVELLNVLLSGNPTAAASAEHAELAEGQSHDAPAA